MLRKGKIYLMKERAKKISTQFLIALLGIALGIFVTAQLRSLPTRVTNPVAPYVSLKETKNELVAEQNELKATIKSLQDSITSSQKETKNVTLTESELAELNQKKAEAGLTRMQGPGIVINLNDSKSSNASEDSIVHASDLRDIVNDLWSNGAEAISINNQRVAGNTAIDCIVNTILINNVRITAPFAIQAIGDRNSMFNAMTSLSNLNKRTKENGLIFDYVKTSSITVPSFDGSFDISGGNSV